VDKGEEMSDKLRAAAQAALSAMSVVRVFVTSKEKIKHPEGTDWYDNIISNLEAALAEPAIKESLTVAKPETEYICKCGLRVAPHQCKTGKEF
jgi:hypothetical protein